MFRFHGSQNKVDFASSHAGEPTCSTGEGNLPERATAIPDICPNDVVSSGANFSPVWLVIIISAPVFLTFCTTVKKIPGQFSHQAMEAPFEANLAERMQADQAQRHAVDDLALYITNDHENLYILIDFVSAHQYRIAREFGFTVYIDSKKNFRRSFGLSYPTGIYYELGRFPGARDGFLKEPGWGEFPENRSLIQEAARNSTRQALIIQRRGRRDAIEPMPVPLPQLQAQGVFLYLEDDERRGRLSLTVPLQITSTSQFSPDVHPGETLQVGFEINPLRLEDAVYFGSAPLITSETASGRSHSDNGDRERHYHFMRMMGDPMETWIEVQLVTD